jgi:hypothetical protein
MLLANPRKTRPKLKVNPMRNRSIQSTILGLALACICLGCQGQRVVTMKHSYSSSAYQRVSIQIVDTQTNNVVESKYFREFKEPLVISLPTGHYECKITRDQGYKEAHQFELSKGQALAIVKHPSTVDLDPDGQNTGVIAVVLTSFIKIIAQLSQMR